VRRDKEVEGLLGREDDDDMSTLLHVVSMTFLQARCMRVVPAHSRCTGGVPAPRRVQVAVPWKPRRRFPATSEERCENKTTFVFHSTVQDSSPEGGGFITLT
jgi:hypothetical protein